MGQMTVQQVAALILPIALVPSMAWCFRAFSRRFGSQLGYLLGFVVYWVVWCTLAPLILLGGMQPLMSLFRPFVALNTLSWRIQLLLWWPVVFPLLFAFVPRIKKASASVVVVSVLLGILIGVTEEVLWRGVYTRLFPSSTFLALIYPSVMFGLWHIAPLAIMPNRKPGGTLSFVAYAVVLGITYAVAARLTGSIAWCTIAHAVHDTLGLGGFAYAHWLTGKCPRNQVPA